MTIGNNRISKRTDMNAELNRVLTEANTALKQITTEKRMLQRLTYIPPINSAFEFLRENTSPHNRKYYHTLLQETKKAAEQQDNDGYERVKNSLTELIETYEKTNNN